MLKVALHNLGCKVNSYETEAMKQLLTGNKPLSISLGLSAGQLKLYCKYMFRNKHG